MHTDGSHVSLLAFFFFAGFGAWLSSGFSAEKQKPRSLVSKRVAFNISKHHKKALTLLCWSRDAVLLGSGFNVRWLLWHLCDRGLLGDVVLHWFLHFGLEKVTTKRCLARCSWSELFQSLTVEKI